MNPIYSKPGEEQYVDVRVKFRVKHSPDREFHLKNILKLNNHYIKGEDIYEEEGRLILEI